MTPRVVDGPVNGLAVSVEVPASKSLTNRALVAAAVADGGRVVRPLDCDDTRVLAAALARAGWAVDWGFDIAIGPRTTRADRVALDLGDSGTGARLLLGLLAATPGRWRVDGSERLRERPVAPLLRALEALGVPVASSEDRLPVSLEGAELAGGRVEIRPEVSSQFVSSLLLAAPLMHNGLTLEVAGPLPSAPYLDLTLDVLRAFGAEVSASPDRRQWRVARGPLQHATYEVEGDWSAAAFFLAATAVAGGAVDVGPLDPASRQGDRRVVRILVDSGLEVAWHGNRLTARGPVTAPISADLEHAPDLFPALVAVAACAPPGSRFSGIDHLAHKESDRRTVMIHNLGRLGAEFTFEGPDLVVAKTLGTAHEPTREVTAAGDHRIAMAMAVAALGAGPLALDDGDCVSKSFPDFWTTWDRLTGPPTG
jgi:3-phosphoshikimate 1-carboxyvinyltransferase